MSPPAASITRAALLAGLALLACAPPQAAPPRALLIGVDGATQRVIRRMIDDGKLPHLAAIARDGVEGALRPEYPLLSPRIWTSVATGKQPSQHGIHHWVRIDGEGRPRLYVSGDRSAHALWNILSDAGLSVGVVNWNTTHPPEKINGVMITDHAMPGFTDRALKLAGLFARGFPGRKQGEDVQAPQRGAAYAYPPQWVERVAALQAGESPPLTSVGSPFGGPEWPAGGLGDALREIYESDALVARAALAVEAEIRPDLLMVYLPGIDRISHFIWDGFEPWEAMPPERRLPQVSHAKSRRALRDYYRFVDAVIGRLLEGRGPEDLVMVISDHGFELGTREGQMRGIHNSEEARDGILYARGRGIPAGWEQPVLSMTEVAPTLLAWFGLGPADDMDGRPARFLRLAVPAPVATYDTTPIERIGLAPSQVEGAIIEQLRELGYLEEEPPAAP